MLPQSPPIAPPLPVVPPLPIAPPLPTGTPPPVPGSTSDPPPSPRGSTAPCAQPITSARQAAAGHLRPSHNINDTSPCKTRRDYPPKGTIDQIDRPFVAVLAPHCQGPAPLGAVKPPHCAAKKAMTRAC